jgi:hypothetical protein
MIAIAGRLTPLLVDFGRKKVGLEHVGYRLLNTDGTVHTARTETGVTAVASGIYRVAVSLPAGWSGAVEWDTGETVPVYAIEAIEVANLDDLDATISSRATLASLANTSIQVVGPVSTTGTISILAGDDYLASDTRALVWEDVTGTRWPSLSGATITLDVFDESMGEKFSTVGHEVSAVSPARKVSVDIPGVDTLNVPGKWRYRLWAVLVDGSKVTLSNGPFTILSPFLSA